MRNPSTISVLLLAVLLSVQLAPGSAEATSDSTADDEVFRHTQVASGWISLVLRTDGFPVQLLPEIFSGSHPSANKMYVFDTDGELLDLAGGSFSSNEDGAHVEARSDDLALERDVLISEGGGGLTMRSDVRLNNIGSPREDFKIVMAAAGRHRGWQLRIMGDPDHVRVTDYELGDRAFFFDSTDFDGDVNVRAQVWPVMARYHENAIFEFQAEDFLLGFYSVGWGSPDTNKGAMTDPSGVERSCLCQMRSMSPSDRNGPGRYTFSLDGYEEGHPDVASVKLVLIDTYLLPIPGAGTP